MHDEHDRMSAFRKFIEESLDLGSLNAAPTSSGAAEPLAAPLANSTTPPTELTPEQYAALREEVLKIWTTLQSGATDERALNDYLTPLERETRNIVVELLLGMARRSSTNAGGKYDARKLIASSVTLGWLVMNILVNNFARDEDDADDEPPAEPGGDIPF